MNGKAPAPLRVRRLTDAGEATKELWDGFNDWTKSLSSFGVQAAYALIAANWAIYGATKTILANPWAKWSMALALLYLGAHLLGAGLMALLYKSRCAYADHDKDRWHKQFEENKDKGSPWPYTAAIQRLGRVVQIFNVLGPLASGACLVVGMFASTTGRIHWVW